MDDPSEEYPRGLTYFPSWQVTLGRVTGVGSVAVSWSWYQNSPSGPPSNTTLQRLVSWYHHATRVDEESYISLPSLYTYLENHCTYVYHMYHIVASIIL